jgi:hypothetical protein
LGKIILLKDTNCVTGLPLPETIRIDHSCNL